MDQWRHLDVSFLQFVSGPTKAFLDSGVYRIHAAKWLFHQEKATIEALVMSTSEAKMLWRLASPKFTESRQ
jgi:hypothetical protein